MVIAGKNSPSGAGTKKITYAELVAGKHFPDYQTEAEYVLGLIRDGGIKPVRSSPLNGKQPALHTRYWLLAEPEDYGKYEEELRYGISSEIDIDYYLRHMETYLRERELVLRLSEYLDHYGDRLMLPMSENERSFDIWQREKFLSGRSENGVSAAEVLKHCGIGREKLCTYRTAEPLAYYSFTKEIPQNLLILENLDPFYSMRKRMLAGENRICGMPFGTLIYGGGKRVARAFADFGILAESYMQAPENRFYYAGDLDYEGIAIFEGLRRSVRQTGCTFDIFPCMPVYRRMLQKAAELGTVDLLPEMKAQNQIDLSGFLEQFTSEEGELLAGVLRAGRYIPQEILSIMDYGREPDAV